MNQKLRFLMLALLCAMLNVAWGQTGTLVESLDKIQDGSTYYIAALNSDKYYTVPNTTISGQTFTCTEGTFSDEKLTPAQNAGEFVFTKASGVDNAYYIYNTSLEKYLVATGSKTFGYVDNTNANYGFWTFSSVTSGGFSGAFSVTHDNKTHYMRAYNNSVRCYDGASNQGVYFFLKEASTSPVIKLTSDEIEIDYNATSGEIAYTIENPVEGNSLSATKDADWISISVGTDKVTFTTTANNGEADRTATITLAYEGATSKTVTVTQKHYIDPNGPGTVNNPYTVAQAIEFINTLGTTTSDIVYVKGIVSQVDSYNSKYSSITYWISDDGSTTGQMQIYSGKGLNGDGFSAIGDLLVGDNVTVKGKVKKYNDTPEFDMNSEITSFNRPEGVVTPPTFSPAAGEVKAGSKVTIDSPDDVDEVEYSYDQESWTAYTNPIEITEATTIYARSKKGDKYSAVVSASYTIKKEQKVVIIEPNKITFDLTVNEWGFPVGSANKEVAEGQFIANGKTLTVAGSDGNGYYFNTDGYVLMGKSGAYLTLPAFDFAVSKIDVVGASGASGSVIQNIFVGENAVSTNTTGAKATNSYEINTNYQAAGTIYTLKVTNAYNTQITKIIVYKKDEPYTLPISSAATDGTSFFATMANIGNGNFIVPDGVKVSTVEVNDMGKIIMSEVGPVIPGSKAYLVEASKAKEYTFAVTTEEPSDVTLGLLEDNMLYPSVKDALTSIAPYDIGEDSEYTFYKLANGKKANSVGFYYGDEDGIPFVSTKENGAFLAVPKDIYDPSASANPGVILINPDDDADGIQGISTSELKNAEVYTLTGVRVQGNLQKGIYIVNGRKQVIK
jgi:hypothetical protein